MNKYDKMVVEYLEHCYRYYVLDDPTISDGDFDKMAHVLYKNYSSISEAYQRFVREDEFFAGTFLGEYPEFTIRSVVGDL